MAKTPTKNKRSDKVVEWYQTAPVYGVLAILSLLLCYQSALIAIDTANLWSYLATIIFLVLTAHHIVLIIKTFREK